MKKYFLLILSLAILASCSSSSKSDYVLINFFEEKFDEFFSEKSLEIKDYTTLETTEESIIGENPRLIIYNDYYYIFSISTKKVLIFDKSGKFIRPVGLIGRGPEEYANADDFCVDKKSNNIEILSFQEQKIVKYAFDGTFISYIKIDGHPFAFAKMDDGKYLFSKGVVADSQIGNAQIYKTDESGKLIDTLLPVNNNAVKVPINENNFQLSNDKVYFKSWFNGNIYLVTKDDYRLSTKVDFKDHKLPDKILEKTTNEFMQLLNNLSYYSIEKYLENDRYIYLYISSFDYKHFSHILYDKKSKKYRKSSLPSDSIYMGLEYAKELNSDNELIFISDINTLNEICSIKGITSINNKTIPQQTSNSDNAIIKLKIKKL